MTIALSLPNPEKLIWWTKHLGKLLPEHDVKPADRITRPEEVRYAVVWQPPAGLLAGYPNLTATISIGAGIDHIAADPDYPKAIPVVKTIGPDMTQRMCEYVALHVLRLHRQLPDLQDAQQRGDWHQIVTPTAPNRKVGVLGLGHLGRSAALSLQALGFDVAGWSRRGDAPDGIKGYDTSQLHTFLARNDILVCLLPLTPDTRGILRADTFAKMPRGASVINAARGAHLVEDDLLAALKTGQISRATLDVFHTEPLPRSHPFWAHPDVLVTPHIASLIDPISGGEVIAANIRTLDAGKTPDALTHVSRGY
ncbi:2-hydroxyacid dehydrogenase [Roseobacter weihaiensis]|uniref:2-hydroxyacid dehydrogenase n=1 Tax=Roseobacter weihaiensis TaxID=2763262 RepID=UPI001D0A54F9|nr:glyoxylate/hydroxypyruvate reductase A [Roseobacter sp. H9]